MTTRTRAEPAPSPSRGGAVLAAAVYGPPGPPPAAGVVFEVPCPPLVAAGPEEILPASGPVETFELGPARAAADGRRLALALEVADVSGGAIETRAYAAYRRLLDDLARAGYPHLLRIWNFVPGINDLSPGLERYKLFSKGRAEAFEAAFGRGFERRLPASSAVGCPGSALVLHAIAAREPGRHVENPRQVSAYRYPSRYGPRSPSFARATVAADLRDGPAIFVSGTASIVGHETRFPRDPARQADETLTNVEQVLAAAWPSSRYRLESLRAYVRNPDDLDAVREVVARRAARCPVVWLQAEICREELLVEIEAVGRESPRP